MGASACTVLALCAPAQANDSSAALGAGGIVLTRSADIRMADERLEISPKMVKIRYVFVNESDKAVDTLVAFPMPDIDVGEFSEVPLGSTTDDPVNFMDFKVAVDGVPVTYEVEQRAFVEERDVTSAIIAAGLPLNPITEAGYMAMAALTQDQRRMLGEAGAADVDPDEPEYFHPLWTVRTKFHWSQHFPAGEPLVFEQSYQPITGQFLFGRYALDPEYEDAASYQRDYCIDSGTKAGLARKIAASEASDPMGGGYLTAYITEYVLRTGANWKGPIGRFHMVLDKLAPGNILSLCWEGGLRKTGPTTFEAELTDFTPTGDIRILVVEPAIR